MLDPIRLYTYFASFPDVETIDSAARALVFLGGSVLGNDELTGILALERCHQLLEGHPHLHAFLKKIHESRDFGPFEDTGT